MPIYEFVCENCDIANKEPEVKELFVSMIEKPVCDVCGQELTKLFSATKGYVRGTTNPVKV